MCCNAWGREWEYSDEGVHRGDLMLNPLHRTVPVCPECGRTARIARGRCRWCDAEVYIPIAYFRWLWFLVATTLVGMGVLTFNAGHAGTWLLVLLVLAVPIRLIWGIVIPPWFELGSVKYGLPLLRLVCCVVCV
jgi:hypothetical protein